MATAEETAKTQGTAHLETQAILADEDLMADLKLALWEIEEGRVVSLEEVAEKYGIKIQGGIDDNDI